ncbi:MAG TPA: hypothetical protein VHN77_01580 [Phycisphaerales bacterium]|nr:hypothetical protein [Phycisphaerales bacterium]
MDPATLKLIAMSTLPTGVVSLLVLLFAWWRSPTRREAASAPRPPETLARLFLPLLLVAACASAMYPLVFQSSLPDFPPSRGRHAVAFVGLIVLVAGMVIIAAQWLRRWIGIITSTTVIIATIAATLLLTLHKQLFADGGMEKWGTVAGAFLVLQAIFSLGLSILAKRTGFAPAVAVFAIAFSVSQVLVLGYHSISECIMAAAVCAVIGGVAVTSFLRPHAALGAAAAMAVSVVLGALLLQGASFGVSDMPWRLAFAAMIAASPWTGLAADAVAGKAGVQRAWLRGGILIAGAAAPAMLAVAIAGKMYLSEEPTGY